MDYPRTAKVENNPNAITFPADAAKNFATATVTSPLKPVEWEPDFPPFPARVSYFIATGKWVSYEELAAKIVEARYPKTIKVAITADTTGFNRAMEQVITYVGLWSTPLPVPFRRCWYKPWTWPHWEWVAIGAILAFFACALFYALGQPV